jgi:lysyl-tRNA synthetase class I
MYRTSIRYLCGCGQVTIKLFHIADWFPTYIFCPFCGKSSEAVLEYKEKVKLNDSYYIPTVPRSYRP